MCHDIIMLFVPIRLICIIIFTTFMFTTFMFTAFMFTTIMFTTFIATFRFVVLLSLCDCFIYLFIISFCWFCGCVYERNYVCMLPTVFLGISAGLIYFSTLVNILIFILENVLSSIYQHFLCVWLAKTPQHLFVEAVFPLSLSQLLKAD